MCNVHYVVSRLRQLLDKSEGPPLMTVYGKLVITRQVNQARGLCGTFKRPGHGSMSL